MIFLSQKILLQNKYQLAVAKIADNKKLQPQKFCFCLSCSGKTTEGGKGAYGCIWSNGPPFALDLSSNSSKPIEEMYQKGLGA